jgi:hypothetical protein
VASATAAAETLLWDVDWALEQLFNRRKTPDPHGLRWWSEQCELAIYVYETTQPREKAAMYVALRNTIAKAKRDYANDFLDHCLGDALWKACKWHKERQLTKVQPLRDRENLTQHPSRMAALLTDKFFTGCTPPTQISQPTDPAPCPCCLLQPVTLEEVSLALAKTSNKSAPGISGIGYKLLKWAFSANPLCFMELYTACLMLGTHP